MRERVQSIVQQRNVAALEELLRSAAGDGPHIQFAVVDAAARSYLDQANYDHALAWMRRALEISEARPRDLLELGRYAEERHSEPRVLDAAIALLQWALRERDPADYLLTVRIYANLAEASHKKRDVATSQAYFEHAFTVNREWELTGAYDAVHSRLMLTYWRAEFQWEAGQRVDATQGYAEVLRQPEAWVINFETCKSRCASENFDVDALLQARATRDADLTRESGAERVRLTTADGKIIWGSYWAGEVGRPGVVLIAMGGWSRHFWRTYARDLTTDGWHVLALDPRGQGLSIGPEYRSEPTAADGLVAINELQARGAKAPQLGLIGGSYGGTVALLGAAASQPPARSLIMLSPGGMRTREQVLTAAARRRQPTLIITSVDDGEFARWNREIFEHAPFGLWEFRILPESGHGTGLLTVRRALWQDLLDWLRRHIAS